MPHNIASLIQLLDDENEVILLSAKKELIKYGAVVLKDLELETLQCTNLTKLSHVTQLISDIHAEIIIEKSLKLYTANHNNPEICLSLLRLLSITILPSPLLEKADVLINNLRGTKSPIWVFSEADELLNIIAVCHVYFLFKSKSHNGIDVHNVPMLKNKKHISIFAFFTNDLLLKKLIDNSYPITITNTGNQHQIEEYFLNNIADEKPSLYYLLYYMFIQSYVAQMNLLIKIVRIQSIQHYFNNQITELDNRLDKFYLLIHDKQKNYIYDYKNHRYIYIKVFSHQRILETQTNRYVGSIEAFSIKTNFVLTEQSPKNILNFLFSQMINYTRTPFHKKIFTKLIQSF